MRFIALAVVAFACCCPCLVSRAQQMEAVFPVYGKDAGNVPVIKGTAFCVDTKQGLLLTAAHVVRDLGLVRAGDPIVIRLRVPIHQNGDLQFVQVDVETRVLAAKYDYVLRPAGPVNEQDWALLQIQNESDRELMDIFRPIGLMYAQTDPAIMEKWRDHPTLSIYGFPGFSVHRRVSFPDQPERKGIWRASGTVGPGFSGAPCMLEDNGRLLTVGLVLEQSTSDTSLVMATHVFMEEMANLAPQLQNVKTVLEVLRVDKSTLNIGEQDRHRLKLLRAVSLLNGIEHWQLRRALCEDVQISDEEKAAFLLGFYSASGHPQFATQYLSNCRMETRVALVRESIAIASAFQRDPAEVPMQQCRAAEEVLFDTLNYLERVAEGAAPPFDGLPKARLADALAGYVFFHESFYRTFRDSPDWERRDAAVLNRAIRVANALDPHNPKVAAAFALRDTTLARFARLAMSSGEVLVRREGSDFVVTRSDNVAVYKLWAQLLSQDEESPWFQVNVEASDVAQYQRIMNDKFRFLQPESLERLPNTPRKW